MTRRDVSSFTRVRYYRIDGATSQQDRKEKVRAFNGDQNVRELFLLRTLVTGLAINSWVRTQTFFDSDWNPQVNLQAKNRAHRICQAKSVLVFRLMAQGTVEHDTLQKAKAKRLLEAIVLEKSEFLHPITYYKYHDSDTKVDMGLEDLEVHEMQVTGVSDDRPLLIDGDPDRLLEHNSEAYARKDLWSSSDGLSTASAFFEVTDSQADITTTQLAHLLVVEEWTVGRTMTNSVHVAWCLGSGVALCDCHGEGRKTAPGRQGCVTRAKETGFE